jgi:hypothetical protein
VDPDIIDWAITLASNLEQLARRGRRNRRPRSQSAPREPSPRPQQRVPPVPVIPIRASRSPSRAPGTPHPRNTFPVHEQRSSGEDPVIPQRSLRRTREVLYPSLNQPPRTLAFVPPVIEPYSSTSTAVDTTPEHSAPQFPEDFYISSFLPTRNATELRTLVDHCQLIRSETGGREAVFVHPLHETQRFSSSPLNFTGLLWKYRVTVTSSGILEEYRRITRLNRTDAVDRAILGRAYTIYIPWNADSWSVNITARG